MEGFSQDPIQFINLIGANLSDRYDSGFPVLKELIQNTDDAEATQLDFGLVAGIDDAEHPLLKGPALFLVNNGEFKESDARGIRSFGLNSKADDKGSIGKFGLGMKSVFHFCEAFFYLASDGENNHIRILNPWSGPDPEESLHNDWDFFTEADSECIRSQLSMVLSQNGQTDTSFILWLPLRKRDHLKHADGTEGWPIVSEYVGDDRSLMDFLRAADLPGNIASLLPMLAHLRGVRFWDLLLNKAEPEFSINLAKNEQRRQLLRQVVDTENQQPVSPTTLIGRIDYQQGSQEKVSLRFAGLEAYGWNDALTVMHDHELWPFSNVRVRYSKPKKAKDKARPHGAAVFSRMPGNGNLTTQWAVFLPMDEEASQTVSCEGDFDFQLTLHGYFFIDAGRKRVDGLELFATIDTPTYDNDKTIKTAWNVELARLQVLPLVLPALADFCDSARLNDVARTALTRSFVRTDLWAGLSSAMTRQHAWLRTVDEQGIGWRLHFEPQRVRALPEPTLKDVGRPWQVFPHLLDPGDHTIFIVESSPQLLNPLINIQWQDMELVDLFRQVDMKAIFSEQTRLDYLVRFCLESAGPHKNTGTVQDELQRLLKDALTTLGEKALQLNRKMIQGYVACLVDHSCLRLENELPPALLVALLQADTDVLPVPSQFIDSRERDAANLSIDDATALLRQIDAALKRAEGPRGLFEKAALKTAEQILRSVNPDSRSTLLSRCADLQILSAYDCRQQRTLAISARHLGRAREQGLLFGFAQGNQPEERRGLAPAFQHTLSQASVLLVNAETCKLVIGQAMKPCKGDAILGSLGQHAHLLRDAHTRSTLASQVGAPTDTVTRKGFRYLLHGKQEHLHADDTLWLLGYEQKPVWQKLWVVMNKGERSPWSLIEEAVADAIPRGLWSDLSIKEIKADAIQQELMQYELASVLDSQGFSQEECADLLADVQDDDLWKMLPFHWSCHGMPVSACGEDVYLSDNAALDEALLANIHLIGTSPDPREARRQQRMLKPLDDSGMLGVLLAVEQPVSYWQDILAVLTNKHILRDEGLLSRTRRTPWVPAANGDVFQPEQVIDLADHMEELDQLYALVPNKFCLPHQLLPALRENSNYEQGCRHLFSREAAALAPLAEVLSYQSEYHVGVLPLNKPEQLERIASVLGSSTYPGWQLLARVIELLDMDQVFEGLWPALRRDMGLEQQVSLLVWLADNGKADRAVVEAFNAYLELFAADSQAGDYLSEICLLNKAGQWQQASTLVAGVEGIVPLHVLDDQQTRLLGKWINAEPRAATCSSEEGGKSSSLRPDASGNTLRDYFDSWTGRVLDPLVAALLVLLGRDKATRGLADEYLGHHSLDWLVDQMPWDVPDTPVHQEQKNWLYGYSLEQALAYFSVAITVHHDKEVRVDSILGDQIKVFLDDQFDTIFVGKPFYYSRGRQGYLVSFVVRKIDPARHSDDELANIIKNSVKYLLKGLYNQPRPMFDSLWAELDKSDQVDIELARALILDNIPFYLKQLGAHKHPELDERLREYDVARKKVAEFKGKEKEQEFKIKQEALLKSVQHLLESNHSVQQSVLDAIRTKVRDYQYQTWSIPFEVFQNADDAVHNLEEIEAWPSRPGELEVDPLPSDLLKFVVTIEADRVSFLHWGRAINQVGSGGFPGKDRKFDNDLENMVILSASDKGNDVTGKFGLGFKSVLLVSDTPEIISGRLHTRVIGGLLPAVWEDSQSVQKLLRQHQTKKQRGTAISLPLREGVGTDFLDPFIQRVGVLAAFSRKIRNVDIVQADGTVLQARWQPTGLPGIAGASVGRIQLGSGATKLVLKMDLGEGALLLGLDSEGFTELPAELPSVWVTAPISESDHLGYAINGTFEIDAGRSRLAADSSFNRSLGEQLGKQLEHLLVQLVKQDRQALQQQLQLRENTSPYELWLSLWQTLLGKLSRIAKDSGVRVIAQPLATAALGRLAGTEPFVPNGLPAELGCLLKWQDVKFIFKGVLAQPSLLQALGSTEFFGQYLKTERAIADEVATWLRLVVPEFGKTSDQWVSQGLSDLLSNVSFREGINQQDASVLGKVFHPQARDGLLEGSKVLLDDFDNSIKHLERLRFQSRAGDWLPASELLCTASSDDERRRCGFAPENHQLASSYDDVAVQFFLLCRRGRLEARSEVLATWMLDAQSDTVREAALAYLLKGDLGTGVAKYLLDGDLSGTWVAEVDEGSPLLSEWVYADKRELIHKILVSSSEIKKLRFEDGLEEDSFEPIDPASALDAIYSWWQKEQEKQLEDYADDVYPREIELIFEDDDEGRFDRSSWLSLLLLGGFHTLGRTKPQQHRGFIEDCQRRDWWRIFSEEHPEQRFQEWMQVLDEFIFTQVDTQEYEQWMMRFPVIYKLSRYLDEYAELFFGLDRHKKSFKLSTVLSPWADAQQQGGGIGAPALGKSLGIGSNFVVRELLRHGVLKSNFLAEHAFVPYKGVRDLMRDMGCEGLDHWAGMDNAPRIYEFMSLHMDKDKMSFDNCWDIPLMLVADDWSLQQELLGREMTNWD